MACRSTLCPGHDVPGPAAEAARPAPAPRGDDHLAAGDRPGRLPLPALDRADPHLARRPAPCSRSAIAFRKQRVLLWPASALLTGNGVAFVLRVPGTAHGDWWSLRGWWIFVGTAGGRAALEVRDHLARRARLQPVEHRARRLLPRARPRPRRAARLLVGPDVGLARARTRRDRRRRLRDPPAAGAAAGRARLLGLVRGRDRRARALGPRDDRALAPRPDHRLPLLAACSSPRPRCSCSCSS